MNAVTIMGRLGRDVEIKKTQSGKSVCSFSLATTDGFGEKKTTTWHNVVAWEKTAEVCAKYLAKGKRALVQGRIQVREYEAKDGGKRQAFEIVANSVEVIDWEEKQTTAPSEAHGVDEVPF